MILRFVSYLAPLTMLHASTILCAHEFLMLPQFQRAPLLFGLRSFRNVLRFQNFNEPLCFFCFVPSKTFYGSAILPSPFAFVGFIPFRTFYASAILPSHFAFLGSVPFRMFYASTILMSPFAFLGFVPSRTFYASTILTSLCFFGLQSFQNVLCFRDSNEPVCFFGLHSFWNVSCFHDFNEPLCFFGLRSFFGLHSFWNVLRFHDFNVGASVALVTSTRTWLFVIWPSARQMLI
jgi:hypothetical protein